MNRNILTASIAAASLLLSADALAAKLKVPAQYGTIQAAVDAANPFDVIEIAKGKYEETVDIVMKNDLKIVGDGKVVIDGSGGGGSIFFIDDSESIRLKNLVLKNGTRGVHTDSSEKVIIEDVVVKNTNLSGIWLESSANVRIIDSSIMDVGTIGIAIYASLGCHVEETEIKRTTTAGIEVSGSQNTIVDCEIEEAGTNGIRLGEGGSGAHGTLVIGNKVVNPTYDCLSIGDGSSSTSVLGNSFKGGDEGIYVISGCHDQLVDDNSFRQNNGHGMELNAQGLTISRNRVKKSGANGIYIRSGGDFGLYHQNSVKKAHTNGFHVYGTGNALHQNKGKDCSGFDLNDTTLPGQNVFSGNSFDTVN